MGFFNFRSDAGPRLAPIAFPDRTVGAGFAALDRGIERKTVVGSDGNVVNAEFPGDVINVVDKGFYIHLMLQKWRVGADADIAAGLFDRLNDFVAFGTA